MSANKLNKCFKLGLPLSLLNFTLFLLFNLFPPLFFLHLLLFQSNTQLLVLFLRKNILQNKTIEERWAFSWKAKSCISNVLFENFKSTHLKSWGSRLGGLCNHHFRTGQRMRRGRAPAKFLVIWGMNAVMNAVDTNPSMAAFWWTPFRTQELLYNC